MDAYERKKREVGVLSAELARLLPDRRVYMSSGGSVFIKTGASAALTAKKEELNDMTVQLRELKEKFPHLNTK
eukprot:m.164612 g.164612  ORF g.164612 m.164612 type:complete len:73 (+) comp16410_c6_seq6:1716-1934(+)